MVVYDNGRVKVMTQPSQVCIMTEDWQRIYITYEELAAIGEAAARHLKCKGCGNEGSAALFRTDPASGNALCTACEGYDNAPD